MTFAKFSIVTLLLFGNIMQLAAESLDAREYYDRGVDYFEMGKLNRAIQDWTHAIRLEPGHAIIYYNRGLAYYQQEKLGKAIVDWNKAIQLDPYDAGTYNNRGLAYARLGKEGKAIVDWNKAVELDPQLAGAYSNRGFYYLRKNQITKACNELKKACELGECNGYNGEKRKGTCRSIARESAGGGYKATCPQDIPNCSPLNQCKRCDGSCGFCQNLDTPACGPNDCMTCRDGSRPNQLYDDGSGNCR